MYHRELKIVFVPCPLIYFEKEGPMDEVKSFLTENGEKIIIRPADPEDAPGILDTLRSEALQRSYVLREQYGRDQESERKYISELDHQRNFFIVAAAGSQVIGCLCAMQADEGLREQTAHILDIGIHIREGYRGCGIGTKMLAHAIEWAQEKGFKKLQARVFITNERSLALFTKAGFTQEGIRRQSIRVGNVYIDEVLMGKIMEREWVLGKYFYQPPAEEA